MRPSSLRQVAPTGQTLTQGAFSQCWQGIGRKDSEMSGYSPAGIICSFAPTVSTLCHHVPGGRELCILHTTAQLLQPMQRLRSMTIPYLGMFHPLSFFHFTRRLVPGCGGLPYPGDEVDDMGCLDPWIRE